MCNLYSFMRSQDEVKTSSRVMRDGLGNLIPQPGIYPDYSAPIVRTGADGVRETAMVRWGMPSSGQAIFDAASRRADRLRAKGQEVDFNELLRMEPASPGRRRSRQRRDPRSKHGGSIHGRERSPHRAVCRPGRCAYWKGLRQIFRERRR